MRSKGETNVDRWKRNLWTLWFTHITNVMCFGFGIPFIPLYIQELAVLSKQQVTFYSTILSAAPAITMAIMAPIWGYLADRYGRKLMIMRAGFFAVFIIGGMGFVSSIGQLIILRILQGMFTGTITAVTAFVASDAPERELGYSLGVISSATFMGFSLGPMVGGFLATQLGYRVSFIVGGSLMFVSFLVVLLFVKEPKTAFIDKRKVAREPVLATYKKVMIPTVILVLLMLFLLRIARTTFSPYLTIFMESRISDPKSVPMITGLVNGLTSMVTAISSILVGKLTVKYDKVRILFVLIIVSIFSSCLMVTQVLSGSLFGQFSGLVSFIVLYVMMFVTLGGIEPTISSISAYSVPEENRGALFGLQGTVGSIAWFFGPAVAGPIAYYNGVTAVLPMIPIALVLMVFVNTALGKSLN